MPTASKDTVEMINALFGEEHLVVSFKYEVAADSAPKITITKYASKHDTEILTEYFKLHRLEKDDE